MERELAKCRDFDVQIEDHGILVLAGTFEYESGGVQGLGYMIDASFLMRFMSVFGVEYLKDVNGKSCWVTHDDSSITKIEPLHKKEGQAFIIKDWQEWYRSRMPGISAYEMLTGKRPRQEV